MGKQTSLYQRHVSAGARIVDFGGWDMPLHYGSQIDEHHAVRNKAGVFDVSHMTVVDVTGSGSRDWLRKLLSNDVDRLTTPGKGLYSCMLNPAGGIIDDLIVYWQGGAAYRVVVNAATRDADLGWMEKQAADFDVELNERIDLSMLAVQGPQARIIAAPLLPAELGEAALTLGSFVSVEKDQVFVARTGYTGEDGWEILLPADAADVLWDDLIGAGVQPCGLGARDTLRLEAGLNLYGQDMTMSTSPLESNLSWTIAWEPVERDFIGRHALVGQRNAGLQSRLVGLVLDGRGVMRAGQRVATDAGEGQITSGGFSPTLQCSIALARLPLAAGRHCDVEIRNKLNPARVVPPSFVKQGQIKIESGES
ncbi:MAG: glycine cleavage system aminomethyltransferase GcvT [Gammaproteobacteria bacterium]|nr:glycine cleavage system aminomethyltransferase GcvT [Gammaproteobacteria bacterium]MCP4830614.1 glycine cleavage system aminomethyltransferase GcvT [Gammaproteobacteria bacterium]